MDSKAETIGETFGVDNKIKTTRETLGVDSKVETCLLYTSPSPRDISGSRLPYSA